MVRLVETREQIGLKRLQVGLLAVLFIALLLVMLHISGGDDTTARAVARVVAGSERPGPAAGAAVKTPPNSEPLAEARRLIRLAQSQSNRELFDQAEGLLRRALGSHPRADEVLAELGHLQLQRAAHVASLMGGQTAPASARELFRRALKINPGSVRALEGLASYHEQRGELSQAVKAHARVIAVEPDNLRAWKHKGKCLVRMKQYARAEKALVNTINKARAAGDLRVVVFTQGILGRIYTKQGRYAEAERTLRKSMDTAEANKVTACPYAALGELYVVTGRKDRLLEVYKRAADMEVHKPRMQYDAALICFEKGEYTNALEYINRALALGARPRHRKLREQIRSEMKPLSPQEYLRIAIKSFNEHDVPRARRYMGRILASGGGGQLAVVRGYLELLEKKYKQARRMFRQARKRDPADTGALVGLGHLDVIAKKYAAARRRFEPAVKAGEAAFSRADAGATVRGRYEFLTYRMACLGMGWLSANQNKHAAAIDHFDRLLARHTDDIFALLGKGNSLNAQNRLDEAARLLKRALKLSPGNKYALAELALVSYNRGDDAEAERLFKAALKRDRTWRYTCPYEGLGLVYLRAGKLAEAKANFRRAIKNNPNIEYKKFNGLARILIREGKLIRARALLRKSMANYPYDGEARRLLAELGKPRGAPPAP